MEAEMIRQRTGTPEKSSGVVRLGEWMVRAGVIDDSQRSAILDAQASCGRPFGELAERMFGVDPRAVESAWAKQYASAVPRIDPLDQEPEPEVLGLVGRREAWQFRVLPIRRDGAEVMVCTTPEHLVRALKFLGWSVPGACYMVLADADGLHAALARHYPMAGLGPAWFQDGTLRAKGRSGSPKLRA
jgi:Type II secretion system (T2SS), protein E, N-terminal domain